MGDSSKLVLLEAIIDYIKQEDLISLANESGKILQTGLRELEVIIISNMYYIHHVHKYALLSNLESIGVNTILWSSLKTIQNKNLSFLGYLLDEISKHNFPRPGNGHILCYRFC